MPTLATLAKSRSIAIRALLRNRLQTILTMSGMTVGVATVLTMIALGTGAQKAIQDQVRAAGMNVIVVTAGNYKMQQQWTSDGETDEAGPDPNPVQASVSFGAVVLAFGVAAATGIFFGFYPAHRASKLNPIDALRFE